MRVDINEINPAFQSLLQDSSQTVFLDANFFIPPDRSNYTNVKPYSFDDFKEYWLIPLLCEFSGAAIHESVYDELISRKVKAYVDEQSGADPAKLTIHYNSELNDAEMAMMNYYVAKIAVYSQYDPTRDNAKDRGEVKSLSFMAVKNYLFFAANDSLPIRLIKNADKLGTGLDNFGIVQMYELIYYLSKTEKYDNRQLKFYTNTNIICPLQIKAAIRIGQHLRNRWINYILIVNEARLMMRGSEFVYYYQSHKLIPQCKLSCEIPLHRYREMAAKLIKI